MKIYLSFSEAGSIVTEVVISAGIILLFATAAMVTACVLLKKKCGKKEQKQASQVHTHTCESIPLSTKGSQSEPGIAEEPNRTTGIVDEDSEDDSVEYDDLVPCQNVQESSSGIQLRVNKSYTSSKISA